MSNKYIHILRKIIPLLLIIFIVGVAAFFRLYKIREYLTFLGDEGRDVLVVKRMLIDKKFTLLGPITSVGSIYMGPVYYYFMTPFLLLFNFDPVGPAVMVALFGILTVILIYKTGEEFFPQGTGYLASLLYSVSPLPVTYGHSSWNPNIVPFFSLCFIYSLFQIWINKKYKWFVPLGVTLGILIQLHYVTFLFFPFLFISLYLLRKNITLKHIMGASIGFVIAYSPFLLFEIRHGFVNTLHAWIFFWQQTGTSGGLKIFEISRTSIDVFVRIFWRLIIVENAELTKIFIILGAIIMLFSYRSYHKNIKYRESIKIISLWLFVGIFAFGLYRGVIYDYYFGSLFGAPYLITGLILVSLAQIGKIPRLISIVLVLLLIYFSLKKSPIWQEPNNQLKNTMEIARFIFEKTDALPYNFALIADKNSDHAYRYFLELWGSPPVTIENDVVDPQRKTVTDQLWIICEEKICQPLGHSLWEIAGYGRSEIESEWQISTAKVFKLRRYQS